jgi:hypothetical protein
LRSLALIPPRHIEKHNPITWKQIYEELISSKPLPPIGQLDNSEAMSNLETQKLIAEAALKAARRAAVVFVFFFLFFDW